MLIEARFARLTWWILKLISVRSNIRTWHSSRKTVLIPKFTFENVSSITIVIQRPMQSVPVFRKTEHCFQRSENLFERRQIWGWDSGWEKAWKRYRRAVPVFKIWMHAESWLFRNDDIFRWKHIWRFLGSRKEARRGHVNRIVQSPMAPTFN